MNFADQDAIFAANPNLTSANHGVVSPPTDEYNCIAFAVGDRARRWDPYGHPLTSGRKPYWPAGCSRDMSPEAIISVFEREGYEPCKDGALEQGYKKVALYVKVNDGQVEVMHVALLERKTRNGWWKSKLGIDADIVHTLEALSQGEYGEPRLFLRCPIGRKGRRRIMMSLRMQGRKSP